MTDYPTPVNPWDGTITGLEQADTVNEDRIATLGLAEAETAALISTLENRIIVLEQAEQDEENNPGGLYDGGNAAGGS